MKLEMTTQWLPIIQVGTYGTEFGDMLNELKEEYVNEFKTQLAFESQNIINEIFNEDWFIKIFGTIVASEAKFCSPQFYNYQNDWLEFNMEIELDTIYKYWDRFEVWDREIFFEWTEKNFGSRRGFMSTMPYKPDDFEYALYTMEGFYKQEKAIAMLILYAIELSKCALDSYQRDLVNQMEEYCAYNGLYKEYEEYEVEEE